MQPIRAAILGFAHMHVNEISQYILEEASVTLVGIADVPPAAPELVVRRYTRAWNLENVAAQHHLTPYDDYRVMLDETKPDICFLLCENANKPMLAAEVARRGISLCIEKPMAVSYAEAQKIATLGVRYGVEILINWPTSWRPYIRRLDMVYRSGAAGRLLKMYYINGHTGPLGTGARHRGVDAAAESMTDAERAATWWYQKKMGGGVFLDIGCYGAMYSTWFQTETPVSVLAGSRNLNTPFCDCADNIAFIVDYPNSTSVIEGTWTIPNKILPTGPVLCCENGVLYCTPEKDIRGMDILGTEIDIPVDMPECDPNIVALYHRHVRDGAALHESVTLPFNLRVMALLDAAMQSAGKGCRVEVAAPDADLQ